MRILFLSDNFIPEVNAPANRTFEHCLEWQKNGAQVTVITCAPNFPQGKIYDGYQNKLYQTETIEGIKVIRVWSYITANEGFLKRILDYLSFCFTSFWAALFTPTDVIIATSPQFFTAVSGFLAALLKRKPWIFEVRDLWPESIKAVNAMSNSTIIHWLEKLELFLYRRANKVVVVTESFKQNLTSRGINPDKIAVVKNGVLLDAYQAQPKDTQLLTQLNLHNKFIVGYLGTHGMAHKLDFIVQCAQHINDPSIHFLFVGDGAEKNKIAQLAHGMTNVTLLPSVPKHEINRYISITDLALVPLKKSDTFKTVIPSKIFENAAMERPILLGVEGESQQIIEHYNAGACFEPENQQSFLQALYSLKQNPAQYQLCQQGCRQLAADFNRRTLAHKLYQIIQSIHN
jgi:glycosyltransferase involved in cell wall biosynthesis